MAKSLDSGVGPKFEGWPWHIQLYNLRQVTYTIQAAVSSLVNGEDNGNYLIEWLWGLNESWPVMLVAEYQARLECNDISHQAHARLRTNSHQL